MLVLETAIVAFSMYSAVPMPHIQWTERNMRFAMCAFPLIGIVIGVLCGAWAWLCSLLGLPDLLRGTGLCLLPVLVTGGIHLDGYADCCDALASHAGQEKMRDIMKDPHSGAFAVIGLCVWFVADWALWISLPEYRTGAVLCSFCLSRALSGLAVVTFPLAPGSGIARSFSEASNRKQARVFLIILAVLLCVALCLLGGAVMAVAALLMFGVYYRMAKGRFGGLSGDPAGWFLQLAELFMLVALCLWEYVERLL